MKWQIMIDNVKVNIRVEQKINIHNFHIVLMWMDEWNKICHFSKDELAYKLSFSFSFFYRNKLSFSCWANEMVSEKNVKKIKGN